MRSVATPSGQSGNEKSRGSGSAQSGGSFLWFSLIVFIIVSVVVRVTEYLLRLFEDFYLVANKVDHRIGRTFF